MRPSEQRDNASVVQAYMLYGLFASAAGSLSRTLRATLARLCASPPLPLMGRLLTGCLAGLHCALPNQKRRLRASDSLLFLQRHHSATQARSGASKSRRAPVRDESREQRHKGRIVGVGIGCVVAIG